MKGHITLQLATLSKNMKIILRMFKWFLQKYCELKKLVTEESFWGNKPNSVKNVIKVGNTENRPHHIQ